MVLIKVRKRAKIRNRYNQAPHLTQDTDGKVTTSQLDITNESQEVSPFPAGDHKALINRRARKHKKQDRNNINDPQKKHRLVMVSKNILLEGLNQFHLILILIGPAYCMDQFRKLAIFLMIFFLKWLRLVFPPKSYG